MRYSGLRAAERSDDGVVQGRSRKWGARIGEIKKVVSGDLCHGYETRSGSRRSWCNTTYWYHEALGEILDTIVVAQFETAIDVRFRAESISGRKRRLLSSFEAILA